MAEVYTAKTPSLSEQYLLKEKEEKLDSGVQPAEELEVKIDGSATTEAVVTPKTEENSVTVGSDEGKPAAADESASASSVTAGESTEAITSAGENSVAEDTQVAAEESTVSAEQEDSGDQEVEETPEVKLETAPADFRFPTTNQTRHCFTRYIEYHRCVAAKGEGAPECDKFAKYYRSLCPGEWIDRWNEQRENGTFPGPL